MTSAIEAMRKATQAYAATTRVLEPPRRPRSALMEAVRVFEAKFTADEIDAPDAIRPLPIVRNYTADLVRLEHEAAEQRERERARNLSHRRQSLAVQVAMRDALIVSEQARAADTESQLSARWPRPIAIAAEARAEASGRREATMLKHRRERRYRRCMRVSESR